MKIFLPTVLFAVSSFCASIQGGEQDSLVVQHQDCQEFAKAGARLKNISGESQQYEVWQSSIAPGGATPRHKHETEEVFVFLEGEGKAVVGDKEIPYVAPCTLVLPADIEHQIFNTGTVPTKHFAILGKGSTIFNQDGEVMHLPWRV